MSIIYFQIGRIYSTSNWWTFNRAKIFPCKGYKKLNHNIDSKIISTETMHVIRLGTRITNHSFPYSLRFHNSESGLHYVVQIPIFKHTLALTKSLFFSSSIKKNLLTNVALYISIARPLIIYTIYLYIYIYISCK